MNVKRIIRELEAERNRRNVATQALKKLDN